MTALRTLTSVGDRLGDNARGALIALVAMVVVSVVSVLVKDLGQRFHPIQMMTISAVVGLAIWIPVAWLRRMPMLPTRRWPLHLLRAVSAFGGFTCYLLSVTQLPLADAVSISFATPLVLIVWAVLFLGEPVRWRRWTATAVGFVGVVVTMRPGVGAWDPFYLVALAGCVLGATAITCVRLLSSSEKLVTMVIVPQLVGLVVSLPFTVWLWVHPHGIDWLWLLSVALLNVAGQILIISAYRLGEATAIAPVDYTRLVFSGVLAYLVFSEVPDLWTLAGAALIVGSTGYIALREAQMGRHPIKRPAPLGTNLPDPP